MGPGRTQSPSSGGAGAGVTGGRNRGGWRRSPATQSRSIAPRRPTDTWTPGPTDPRRARPGGVQVGWEEGRSPNTRSVPDRKASPRSGSRRTHPSGTWGTGRWVHAYTRGVRGSRPAPTVRGSGLSAGTGPGGPGPPSPWCTRPGRPRRLQGRRRRLDARRRHKGRRRAGTGPAGGVGPLDEEERFTLTPSPSPLVGAAGLSPSLG